MNDINEILKERGSRYGDFKTHAEISQKLRAIMWCNVQQKEAFKHFHIEALDMIAHKIGRIINGDPNYIDSWRDIAGYAQLVVKELEKEDEQNGEMRMAVSG